MSKCKAFMEFGDDHGDNTTTFHCELEEGHEGLHTETGKMYDKFPYTVSWEKDMKFDGRTLCPKCDSHEVDFDWERDDLSSADVDYFKCKKCDHHFEVKHEEE
jgi:hypothetical protein